MNYLEIKIAPREYPSGLQIESDEEAQKAYSILSLAMKSGEVVELTINGTITTIRGSDLKGVGLTPSSVLNELNKKMEEERLKFSNLQAQTSNAVCASQGLNIYNNKSILN